MISKYKKICFKIPLISFYYAQNVPIITKSLKSKRGDEKIALRFSASKNP